MLGFFTPGACSQGMMRLDQLGQTATGDMDRVLDALDSYLNRPQSGAAE